MIRRFRNWFLRTFVCPSIFVDGHIPVKEVRETDLYITQYKCKRCDCNLGLGYWKHMPDIPGTEEQKEEWRKYQEHKLSQLRKGIIE